MKKIMVFLFFVFLTSSFFAETDYVGNFNKKDIYEFNGNLQSCKNLPDGAEENEAQGMAHVEKDTVWFMSSETKLDVYDGFFERNNGNELLKSDCSIGEDCYTYADHLGDVDFDQKNSRLYIPLEELRLFDDDSGYSVYRWYGEKKEIKLEKFVILESSRNASSAAYAAYNSIDNLVYMQGYDINEVENINSCYFNRICGYNPDTAEEITAKKYIGDISSRVLLEVDRLNSNIKALENVQNMSEETFKNPDSTRINMLDILCFGEKTKEECETSIRKKIALNQENIDFLTSNKDFKIYKTRKPEKIIIMMAECGRDDVWASDIWDTVHEIDPKFIYNKKEYCEVNHKMDDDFSKQGAVFSPNHRFLFYVHHSTGNDSKTTLYVYYFPDTEWVKFYEKNLKEPIYAVFAGTIHHKIDTSILGKINQELEGVDVWNGEIKGEQCDLHEMMLNNDVLSSDNYYIWHWLFQDSDGDGISDLYDNCIFVSNNSSNDMQKDSDRDGIGDACDKYPNFPNQQDIDKDSVPDKYDNCLYKSNQDQKDSDGDKIGDKCDNCPDQPNIAEEYSLNNEFISGYTGAISQNVGTFIIKPLIKNQKIYYDFYYKMQPDSDLDGIGDACDFGDIEDGGFANSKIKSIRSPIVLDKIFKKDPALKIKLEMPENSGSGLDFCYRIPVLFMNILSWKTVCPAAVHYCAVSPRFAYLWGQDGYCSTSDKVGGTILGHNFGYSHGSDDFSLRSIESWQSRISVASSYERTNAEYWSDAATFGDINNPNNDKARKYVSVSTEGETVIWNWRRDWYQFNGCVRDSSQPICQNLLNGGDYDEENTMYYTLSTNVLPLTTPYLLLNYIPPYTSYDEKGELIINDKYFPPTNTNKFARAARYNIEPKALNYHTFKLSLPNPPTDVVFPSEDIIIFPRLPELPNIDLCNSCYFDIPIRYFGLNEIKSYAYEYVSRYEIKKGKENNMLLDRQRVDFPKNQIAFSEISPKEMIGVIRDEEEYFLALNTVESGADWNRIGRIEKWDFEIGEIESFAANYFIAKTAQGGKNLYSIELISEIPENLDDIIDIDEIPEMLYALNNLGDIGFDLEQTKLIFANGRLYLFAQNGNSFGMFWLDGTNFEEIQGVIPPKRNILNISASGKYMFLAGGTDFNNETMNDLWRFDTDTNTWEQIPATLKGDFTKVIMQEVNGKMVAFNPVIDDNTTFPVFEFENFEDVENIEVSYSVVKIDDIDFDQNFCILENNNSIFPGITNVYGECVKVQNYDFNEVTFPDYKLSVAGYKNSLYLGGLTGIRRVEIGENGEITKKEMIYSGESNNLAVYGNTLYAANYSEIDIFEIAEDGSISRKSSVKTSNCQNIRIYGGKLFAAENKRVRIFDLSDPIEPELLKTISLSNTVEDLEIAGNQLFVYENLNSLLTRKGKVSVFDISDLENTQKVSDFSQYCNDPEMQKSGNNVYLGCKNGSFKVEETGLQKVNGSKNYLREGYVYDGILYQVFSGTLHESKVEPEETEEDGWI